MKFPSYLAALVLFPLSLNAENVNDKLIQLQKVGEDFAGATAMGGSTPAMKGLVMEQREFSNNFGSIQSYVQESNYDQAIRTLQRWLKRTQNAQVKTALEELLKGLKEEQTARVAKLAVRVDEFLATVGANITEVTTPDQIANIQFDLEEFRNTELNGGDRSTRVLNERVNRAINFLNNWQQVILSELNGDYSQALQALNNLRRNPSVTPLVAAPTIAKKYQQLLGLYLKQDTTSPEASPFTEVIAMTMAKVKTPADVAEAASVMAKLNSISSGNDNRLLNQLQNQLNEITQIQSEIEGGSYGRAMNRSNNYLSGNEGKNPYQKQLLALRDELRRQALAAVVKNAEQKKEEESSPLGEVIAKIMAKVKTPADAAVAYSAIMELNSMGVTQYDRSISVLQNQLNEVVQMESNFQAGSYASLINTSNYNNAYGQSAYTKQLQALKDELRRQALAAVVKNAEQMKEDTSSPLREIIAKIMAKVKTPADTVAAYAAISELSYLGLSGNGRLLSAVQNQLNEVVQMVSDYQSGAYGKIISSASFNNSYGPTPYTSQLQGFKDELRARAVAAANELPDLGTPKADESFPSFVRRLADEAYAKKDWEQLYTLLTVYSTVSGGGCARTEDMQGAVAAYLAGVQLQAAQQFGDAVLKYTYCVSKLGKLVPRAEATAALERLRREHPAAFAPTGNLR